MTDLATRRTCFLAARGGCSREQSLPFPLAYHASRLAMPPKSKAVAAAAAEPVAVEDLFTSLHRHIEAGAFEQAAKVADQGQTLLLLPPAWSRVSCPNPPFESDSHWFCSSQGGAGGRGRGAMQGGGIHQGRRDRQGVRRDPCRRAPPNRPQLLQGEATCPHLLLLARWVCPFPLLSSLPGSLGTRLVRMREWPDLYGFMSYDKVNQLFCVIETEFFT